MEHEGILSQSEQMPCVHLLGVEKEIRELACAAGSGNPFSSRAVCPVAVVVDRSSLAKEQERQRAIDKKRRNDEY